MIVYPLERKVCLTIEQRYLDNGKVKCRSKYLGQNPLDALAEMFSAGEIDHYTYERLTTTG